MHTRIKICGIRDEQTALAAARAGADAIGLVLAPASPRYVTIEQAVAIARAVPPFVEPAGLFVDASAQEILAAARSIGLRTIQLHGNESPDLAQQLAPMRIIKALHFDDHFDQSITQWCSPGLPNLAAILIDTPPKPRADIPGGSGRPLNWSSLAKWITHHPALNVPLILAGGLTPENVAHAISTVHPYAVDVSSGVESARGIKDPARIAAFCDAVQNTSYPTAS